MNKGDKYHRKGKLYTVIEPPDNQLPERDQQVKFEDSCGTKSTCSLLYFLQNYSKHIPGLTIIK